MSLHPVTLRADWPFGIRRVPFFYGWVIWALSTVGILMSVPGQTMGIAVFTDTFIGAFDLTRTQLAVAYFAGTVSSAFLLPVAGRAFDRYGARLVMSGAALGLAGLLVFISGIDRIAASLGPVSAWVTFPLIFLGYFGVRFFGQGVLTSASRNVLVLWFERRRGFVVGMSGPFVSLGFSISPLLLAVMITELGWRGALWAMAFIVGVVFVTLVLALVRDTPESCGVLPDGDVSGEDERPEQLTVVDKTAAEARRTPIFWIYSLGLASHALFGTAVTFHIVSIFEEAGRTAEEAFVEFFPASAVISIAVNVLAGWLSDRKPLKLQLVSMLMLFVVGAVGLLNLHRDWGLWLLIVGLGAGGGLWVILSNIAFVRFFGRKHLGEITGFNISIIVFGSAIGPVLFSLGRDSFGSYQMPTLLCIGGLLVLLTAAIAIPQPDPLMQRRKTSAV